MEKLIEQKNKNKDDILKRAVMTRVRTVYVLRWMTSPLVVKIALFVLSFVAVNYLVSVRHVIINISQLPEFTEGFHYLVDAFIHTRVTVQIALFLTALFFVALAGDIGRSVRHVGKSSHMAHSI